MAVQGDVLINFLAKDIKSFSAAVGNAAIPLDWRLGYPIDATQVWHDRMALTAGAATVSLVALPRVNQPTLDLTGLTVTWIMILNQVGNASVNFVPAVANGYPFAGATDGVDIGAGGLRPFYEPAGFGVVSGTLSEITVAGTGAEVFEMLILAKA